MGAYSAVTNRESPIGRILARGRDGAEVYQLMIEEASTLYDRNFDYAIRTLNAEGCTVTAKPSQLVQDIMRTHRPGSLGACATRAGVFESAMTYIQAPASHVDEIRCVHRGDPVCEYRIRYV